MSSLEPAGLRRWALILEYDGTGFHGLQSVSQGLSVQGVLETALGRLEPDPVRIHAAGRTDAGVHAAAMVVHADLTRDLPPERLIGAINFHCRPHPLVVLAARVMPPGFHARLDCIERRYRYRILTRAAPPILERDRVWQMGWALDLPAMQQAAEALIGRHDFTSFRATHCQAKSPIRTLDALTVLPGPGPGEIRIEARARSFLHHQIRNMVGSLVAVGRGRWPVARMAEVLAARDRRLAAETAPAEGLCFLSARYPDWDAAGFAESPIWA